MQPNPQQQLGILKIVSGAQTGADRAALDFAIEHNIPYGGWCPKARRAEDGEIAASYILQETLIKNYTQRTEWNVRDSDGTVIFTMAGALSGGSKKTMQFAKAHQKPWLHLSGTLSIDKCAGQLRQFISDHQIHVLNMAGSRASKEPAVGHFVQSVLDKAFRRVLDSRQS